MTRDEALEEIRKVRHEISMEVAHDPRKLVEYYAELQRSYPDRLIREPSEKKGAEPSSS